ncbi:MAG TPA: YfiR family protein [Sedimentisphaerales bacterium]|nr:YfiR family protein [Sedimentisphaerales bacterium]
MKIKVYILFMVVLVFLALDGYVQGEPTVDETHELQLKAAFIYNFIQFVDWTEEKMPKNDEPIIIGVINAGEQINLFDKIKSRQAKGKNIIIEQFEGLEEFSKYNKEKQQSVIEQISKTHILFFCKLSQENTRILLKQLSSSNVLTIGQSPDFLEYQGNINFVLSESKIKFEINLVSAKANNLKISSKLLALAQKVIVESEGAK